MLYSLPHVKIGRAGSRLLFSTLWLSSGSTWHWLALALLWHAARLKDICGPVETVATFGKMG